jgi:hypothetical protein
MHARYYCPNLGRFLSVDPVGGSVGSSQSWNRYSYVLNNPLKLVDPDGNSPQLIGGLIGAIGGAIVGGYQESVRATQERVTFKSVVRNVGASVVGGAITGATAATFGPTSLSGGLAVGSGTSLLGGGVRRALDDPSSGQSFADPIAAVSDVVAGGIGGTLSVGGEGAVTGALRTLESQKELEKAMIVGGVKGATGGSATGTAALVAAQQAAIDFLEQAPVASGAVLGETTAQSISPLAEEYLEGRGN